MAVRPPAAAPGSPASAPPRPLARAVHGAPAAVLRRRRVATRVANLGNHGLITLLDRAGGIAGRRWPAGFGIDLDVLHRLEGHWALTFARLGTIHLPPAKLRGLGAWLDARSYFRVLWASRRSVGPATVRLVAAADADAAPAVGRSIRVGDDYYGRAPAADTFRYPYVMHPWLYAVGRYRRVVGMRRAPRRFRLFFSGPSTRGIPAGSPSRSCRGPRSSNTSSTPSAPTPAS